MDKPMLMKSHLVEASLYGLKTETRRVIVPQPEGVGYDPTCVDGVWNWMAEMDASEVPNCVDRVPRYSEGDILWVRETFWQWGKWVKNGETKTGRQAWTFKAVGKKAVTVPQEKPRHRTDLRYHKRPSIFMPRWASRPTVRVLDVHPEKLQDITHRAIGAEGLPCLGACMGACFDSFRELWDSINAARGYGWDTDPWVWVYGYRRVTDAGG